MDNKNNLNNNNSINKTIKNNLNNDSINNENNINIKLKPIINSNTLNYELNIISNKHNYNNWIEYLTTYPSTINFIRALNILKDTKEYDIKEEILKILKNNKNIMDKCCYKRIIKEYKDNIKTIIYNNIINNFNTDIKLKYKNKKERYLRKIIINNKEYKYNIKYYKENIKHLKYNEKYHNRYLKVYNYLSNNIIDNSTIREEILKYIKDTENYKYFKRYIELLIKYYKYKKEDINSLYIKYIKECKIIENKEIYIKIIKKLLNKNIQIIIESIKHNYSLLSKNKNIIKRIIISKNNREIIDYIINKHCFIGNKNIINNNIIDKNIINIFNYIRKKDIRWFISIIYPKYGNNIDYYIYKLLLKHKITVKGYESIYNHLLYYKLYKYNKDYIILSYKNTDSNNSIITNNHSTRINNIIIDNTISMRDIFTSILENYSYYPVDFIIYALFEFVLLEHNKGQCARRDGIIKYGIEIYSSVRDFWERYEEFVLMHGDEVMYAKFLEQKGR